MGEIKDPTRDKGDSATPETEKIQDIRVAVSELRGDNVLDEETIGRADLVELKFLDKEGVQPKERLVHIFPYYERAGNKVSLDIAGEDFAQNVQNLGLPEKINQIDPEWVSLHFGWMADPSKISLAEMKKYRKPEISAEDEEKLFRAVCSNINSAKQLFGGREILLENLDFIPNEKHGGTAILMSDPQFISRVLEETGTGLLLDLEHALVSARNLGMKYSEYLSKLPLDKVREIHASRPAAVKRTDDLRARGKDLTKEDEDLDFLVDTHRSLTTPDGKFSKRLQVLFKAFANKMPNLRVITIELNLPPDQMQDNIAEIKDVINRIKQEKAK